MKLKTALLALAVFATACSDSEDPTPPDSGTPDPDAGATQPLYAAITQVAIAGGNTQSYLVTLDDIEEAQTVGIDEAIELPSDSYIATGVPGTGRFFVSSSRVPTMTPYTLTANGSIVAADPLSFTGQGVAATNGYQSQHYFVSETKAYYFDHVNYKLVIWNPQDLSIITSKDLTSELKDGDFTFRYSQSLAVTAGNDVIIAGGWHASDVRTIPAKTALVIVDTQTDEVTVKTDNRCGWARDGVKHTDGKVYYATESLGSGAHFVSPGTAGAPCMIRFNPATGEFDSWFTTLDSFVNPGTEGDIAAMLLPGAPGKGYLRVMNKTAAQTAWDAAVAAERPFNGQSAAVGAWWSLWEVTLGEAPTATAVVRDDLVPTNGRTIPQNPGELLVLPEFINDNAQTRFRLMSPETGLGDAKTVVEGQVRGLLRIR
ncbi:hypothetical protein [Corallococcus macrosporus]|uniref:MxcI protein n=1 Tax=Corallococcus macrosporus DSM 14697 TaxID=1189310 RepID=A0A250JRG8_9BACT|nr:hypothetical protein [Corallococcus macrosporus]ATB46220.1 hypothetical protein MYMAC_001812 [Corallococcus macrosporus DSM 14697]